MTKERFFYTTHYPHRWTTGPDMRWFDDDYTKIKSLERAKELAEKHRRGSWGEDRVETTYGVEYEDE